MFPLDLCAEGESGEAEKVLHAAELGVLVGRADGQGAHKGQR